MAKLDFDYNTYESVKWNLSRHVVPLEPLSLNVSPDPDIWQPMQNATITGQIMTIVFEFFKDATGILFKDQVFNKPGILGKIRLGILAFKLIVSVIHSIQKK